MKKLNVLTIEVETEVDEQEEKPGYVFKIDGERVEDLCHADSYYDADFVDIVYGKFLESSELHDECQDPTLAWDDQIKAYVTVNEDTVQWKVYKVVSGEMLDDEEMERKELKEGNVLGEFTFERTQYEATVREIKKKAMLEDVKMTHEQIVKEIKDKLSEIEKRENIRIIYACESGSRAWGFASLDSDYDVRFVYVRPLKDYLKLEEIKDTLECELNEVYDISGWDIKKLLSLLERSNPSIFEWAASPIVYKERREWKKILAVMSDYFSVEKSLQHYNSFSKKHLKRYFDGKDEVTYKKYLYNLRHCLSCEWVMDRKTPPTIEFPVLVDSYLPAEFKESVAKLLEMKVSMAEKQTGSRIQVIDEYIQTMVDKVDRYLESMEITRNPGLNKLDSLFLKLVR